MKTYILILLALLFNAFNPINAQTDSTFLDLGRIKLKKDFTQSITIKGSDLERLPFTNLTEVINVWLYGYYSDINNVTYIIDGFLVTDVNAYSIYDIDEITLIQNALIQVSGIYNQQQLIIITTKKAKGKQGIIAAAKTFLVNRGYDDTAANKNIWSKINFYHQYYLSAYKNANTYQTGISFDFLRDALPVFPSVYKTDQPSHIDRYRLHGYFDLQLGSKNKVSVNGILTPQPSGFRQSRADDTSSSNFYARGSEALFSGTATLKTRLLKNLVNELGFTYNVLNSHERSVIDSLNNNYEWVALSINDMHSRNFLIQDNLSYSTSFGKWHFDPSLNFSWRKTNGYVNEYNAQIASVLQTQVWSFYSGIAGKHSFLTPSFNLNYSNLLNLQGGILTDLTSYGNSKHGTFFPFVNFSVAPFMPTIQNKNIDIDWRIYGSYAKGGYFFDDIYTLSDFSNINSPIPVSKSPGFFGYSADPGYTFISSNIIDSSFWMLEAGTSVSFLNNRLKLSYVFEKRKHYPQALVPVPIGTNFNTYAFVFLYTQSITNHISITGKIVDGPYVKWNTQINITNIRNLFNYPTFSLGGLSLTGDINGKSKSWTGGWTNRFQFGSFIAGFDVLYWLGNKLMIPGDQLNSINSVSLQYMYFGYTIHSTSFKDLELYASLRNLAQNQQSVFFDQRKYYGLGAKWSF